MQSISTASIHWSSDSLTVRIGQGSLELDLSPSAEVINPDDFKRSGWDVVCGAVIGVGQDRPTHKRSANCWYTRQRSKAVDYRWYEVGYEGNPLTQRGFEFAPAAASVELADRAHSNAMDVVQVSCGPYPIDDEDTEFFLQRWTHILAEAAVGALQRLPRRLPEKPPF